MQFDTSTALWANLLFMSSELGLNLLMNPSNCTGRCLEALNLALRSLCDGFCNLNQSHVSFFFLRLKSPSTDRTPKEVIPLLIAVPLWIFSNSIISPRFFVTETRTTFMLKMRAKLGYTETQQQPLFHCLLLFLMNSNIWLAFRPLLST